MRWPGSSSGSPTWTRCRCPGTGAAGGSARAVEFWQGRDDRMHDRLRFEVDGIDRTWKVTRLAP